MNGLAWGYDRGYARQRVRAAPVRCRPPAVGVVGADGHSPTCPPSADEKTKEDGDPAGAARPVARGPTTGDTARVMD